MCNMMTPRKPSDRLTYARIKAGYEDQKDFSTAFGIKPSTYTHHENGTRGLRPAKAEEYARLLKNCSAEWLLYGKGRGPDDTAAPGPIPSAGSIGSDDAADNPEEIAAFMVLYDRLATLTENANERTAEQFGLVARPFGYDGTPRGLVQMTAYLWRKIVHEDNDSPLLDRVFKRVSELEHALRRVHDVLREISKRLKADDTP